jgi:hypothetical protein
MARLAKSLETLRDQIDALAPGRDKSSDGWIASAQHHAQNPNSDHEADAGGVVRALDITNDPAHGVVAADLAEQLRQSKDPRIKYIISNRRISNPTIQDWAWRPYSGSNPHDKHFHTSVVADDALADATTPWVLELSEPTGEVSVSRPRIQKGSKGPAVSEAQRMLGISADGVFGPATVAAVIAFQVAHGLEPDGVVGPYTWDALLGAPGALSAAPPSSGRQTGIIATVFSSDESGQKGAYGDHLDPSDIYLALPATMPRGTQVRVIGPLGSMVAPVLDKGPWNAADKKRPGSRDDPYWQTGARPQAESGTDYTGRPTNHAGIDLSPALAKAIGIAGKGAVDWEFVTAAPAQPSFPDPIPRPPIEVGGGFPFPFPSPGHSPEAGGGIPWGDLIGVALRTFTGGNADRLNLPMGNLQNVIAHGLHIATLAKNLHPETMTIEKLLAAASAGLSTLVEHQAPAIVGRSAPPPPTPLKLPPPPSGPPPKGKLPMTPQQILEIVKWIAALGPVSIFLAKYGIGAEQIDWVGKLIIGLIGTGVTGLFGYSLYQSRPTGLALAVKNNVPDAHVVVNTAPGSQAPQELQALAKDRNVSKIEPARLAA